MFKTLGRRPQLTPTRWDQWLFACRRWLRTLRADPTDTPPIIFSQIMAFDGIAMAAARVRGHKLGDWTFHGGRAEASCTRCGRRLVAYYARWQPDMGGSVLLHACRTRTDHPANSMTSRQFTAILSGNLARGRFPRGRFTN